MRIVGRLLALLAGGLMVAGGVAAVAAQRMKRDFVPVDDPAADEIRLAAIFEPLSFRSAASSFRGGTVDCRFGGGVLDLTEATLDPAGAHLTIKAIFGGGQILVPDDWRVITSFSGIGGIGDARLATAQAEDSPTLTIEVTTIFGGFGVTAEPAAEAGPGVDEAATKVTAPREPADVLDDEAVATH